MGIIGPPQDTQTGDNTRWLETFAKHFFNALPTAYADLCFRSTGSLAFQLLVPPALLHSF